MPPSCVAGPFAIDASDTITADVDAYKYYCGMTINDGVVVTFLPGVYHIAGPVTAKTPTSNVTLLDLGAGVTFFIAAPCGSFDLPESNGVTLNLRAPDAGPYKGILFYQERGNMNAATILKDNGSLTGALYFPGATLTMRDDLDPSDCMLIVANNLTIENNTDLIRDCASYGGSPVQTITVAE